MSPLHFPIIIYVGKFFDEHYSSAFRSAVLFVFLAHGSDLRSMKNYFNLKIFYSFDQLINEALTPKIRIIFKKYSPHAIVR